jgi:hypothetical protein
MQNPGIPSLPRNSDDHQVRVHPTRARRFIDHLTGEERETAVRVIPRIQGGAPKGAPIGQGTPNHLGGTLNERLRAPTRAILPNIYAETR